MTRTEYEGQADGRDLVDAEDACPGCGERDMDRLVWLEDGFVRCTICGRKYSPSQ